MTRQDGTNEEPPRRATVCVPVPALDPGLFRHKATGDVLRVLVENPYETFTIRELARLTDNVAQSVKRAVDVLAANELVEADAEGNRRLVGINTDYVRKPGDPVLAIPQREFHAPVRAALDRLRDELEDVRGILVFGSVAQGTADRRSDVDLWVLHEGSRAVQHQANEIASDLGKERFDGDRYEFQILAESPESARAHGDRLKDVFADAITLVDSEPLRELKREVLGNA